MSHSFRNVCKTHVSFSGQAKNKDTSFDVKRTLSFVLLPVHWRIRAFCRLSKTITSYYVTIVLFILFHKLFQYFSSN